MCWPPQDAGKAAPGLPAAEFWRPLRRSLPGFAESAVVVSPSASSAALNLRFLPLDLALDEQVARVPGITATSW
jgi:hypothetical protein